ncbi:hypothetical protein S40285_09964 [Stachybotrys chlorohalonatus IBT 40285]|uniref:Uncharacterized protein n=1 Tax=Stachybotrys chlorohalonatus (strain IBT 40285) TaxID=1283841 RepID=A0A084QDP0_STAC4|nr:hypothetical protein S40285_09964 [Stachybotrys chlorohalonata IBT 40285]
MSFNVIARKGKRPARPGTGRYMREQLAKRLKRSMAAIFDSDDELLAPLPFLSTDPRALFCAAPLPDDPYHGSYNVATFPKWRVLPPPAIVVTSTEGKVAPVDEAPTWKPLQVSWAATFQMQTWREEKRNPTCLAPEVQFNDGPFSNQWAVDELISAREAQRALAFLSRGTEQFFCELGPEVTSRDASYELELEEVSEICPDEFVLMV